MAYLSLIKKDLESVLNFCNLVSPKRSEIELFTYTKFEVVDSTVVLTCINSSMFYSTSLNVSNLDFEDSQKSLLIKTDIFASCVSLISDDTVSLEIDFEKLTMVVQDSKTKHTLRINTQSLEDFQIPKKNPELLQTTVRVLSKELLDANKASFVSVGQPKNVYQPDFLNVCYTLTPGQNMFTVVSTDRYRITKTVLVGNFTHTSEDLKEGSTNFLISPKNLQLLDTWLGNEESVEFHFEKDYLWVEIGSNTLIFRYGEGKYPDYEKIIPQSFTCSFTVDTKEMIMALKQVYLFAKSNVVNKSITLKVNPQTKKITFTAQTQDGYSSESSLPVENYEGVQEEWNQSFNADYLMDYVVLVSTPRILWESNPGKPSVLSPENKKETQLYLVSGLR